MFALVDCNSFYASCEKVFEPRLQNRPVVVLSNNDGCVIARCAQAKGLIKMGAVYHEIEKDLKKHQIRVFSSNYPLYGDMSQRVMDTLSSLVAEVEVYSIDESFLNLSGYMHLYPDLTQLAFEIRRRVLQWTGIPVSIGVAPTKTLAKAANKLSKKHGTGVYVLENSLEIEEALRSIKITDVWGIGRRYAAMLKEHQIENAHQFTQAPENWVRQKMTVVGQRLYLELKGYSCIPLELVPKPKKAIGNSRSFRTPVKKLAVLKEAVATFISRCGEKLRKQKSCASVIMVFIRTNRFKKDAPQYGRYQSVTLPVPTDSTLELIKYGLKALEFIYKEGYEYKKAGVLLSGVVPAHQRQSGAYDQLNRQQHSKAMQVMDEINTRMGRFTVRSAAMGNGKSGATVQRYLSKQYTTKWEDVIVVKAI